MATAVLTILGDASGARRAFAELRAEGERTTAALGGTTRHGSADRRRLEAEEIAETRRQLRAQQQARLRALRERQRAEEAATRQRERAAKAELAAHVKAEREKTRSVARESKLREQLARREASEKTRLDRETTRTHEREERRRTQLAEQEARKRVRAQVRAERERRQRFGQIGNVVVTGGRAVGQFAGDVHGQIQDARQRRAVAGRVLDHAVRNAGGSRDDVIAARTRVQQFAHDAGMTYADVADALSVGQARGSSLEAGAGETRAQALDRALGLVREANAEGADPGQYLAARGRLAASGLQGDALKTAMRFALAAAQSGQVEIDQIIAQGLPGASRLMEARVGALGPNATEAQRQAARLHAWRESVATQEVLAASGGQAGHTANTLASLQNFLNTPRRQEMALTNIRNAERQVNTRTPEGRARAAQLRALYEGETAMFERDPTRRGDAMRLKAGVSPIEFASRVAAATGGNAQAGANLFAGGGHGNAQSFLVNMRNLMGVLGSERGRRIETMMRSGGLSDATVQGHQQDVESDDLANLNRNQEAHDRALTDNTSKLVDLSRAFADWSARNPLASSALEVGGGLLGSLVTGSVVGKVLGRAVPTGGATGLLGTLGARATSMATAARSVLPSVSSLRSLAPPLVLASLLKLGGSYGGVEQGDVERQHRESAEWARQSELLDARARATGQAPPTAAEIGAAVAAALRAQPLTATVDPHDARHAASGSRSP